MPTILHDNNTDQQAAEQTSREISRDELRLFQGCEVPGAEDIGANVAVRLVAPGPPTPASGR